MIWKNIVQNVFFGASNSSDIKEGDYSTNKHTETIRDGTSRAIPKKPFVTEERN